MSINVRGKSEQSMPAPVQSPHAFYRPGFTIVDHLRLALGYPASWRPAKWSTADIPARRGLLDYLVGHAPQREMAKPRQPGGWIPGRKVEEPMRAAIALHSDFGESGHHR